MFKNSVNPSLVAAVNLEDAAIKLFKALVPVPSKFALSSGDPPLGVTESYNGILNVLSSNLSDLAVSNFLANTASAPLMIASNCFSLLPNFLKKFLIRSNKAPINFLIVSHTPLAAPLALSIILELSSLNAFIVTKSAFNVAASAIIAYLSDLIVTNALTVSP